MKFLKIFWDLFLYRRRKFKAINTLRKAVKSRLLTPDTYFMFYSLRIGLGEHYARTMIRRSIIIMVKKNFSDLGLEAEFYSSGMNRFIEEWVSELTLLNVYGTGGGRQKYVFIRHKGVRAKRIYLQVGDEALNSLVNRLDDRINITDAVFDLLNMKADPEVPTILYADLSYSVYVITLKDE